MDLETITIVTGTAGLIAGGAYGVRSFLPKLGSAYATSLGYAVGEGIGQGVTLGVHKAFTGEDLDPRVFETPELRAKRWNYTKPVLISYLGFIGSSMALCVGICSGIPASLLEFMAS
ncbi:MAG: hypothetical protein Q8R18_06375 [bacterium]|nr:hypothetical protein [bacterium]